MGTGVMIPRSPLGAFLAKPSPATSHRGKRILRAARRRGLHVAARSPLPSPCGCGWMANDGGTAAIDFRYVDEENMGKAADNEKHKLKANFYNNVAASFIVTGVVVPYLAFVFKLFQLAEDAGLKGAISMQQIASVFLTIDDLAQVIVLSAAAVLTWKIAMTLREGANQELEKIVD
jgi:hypothetical protein